MTLAADAPDPCATKGLVELEQACAIAATFVTPIADIEEVSLEDADGRCLGRDAVARIAMPPFDQSAMDGYALASAAARSVPARLEVAGRTVAGDGPTVVAHGAAHRIFTGAPVPAGADSVVMQEHVVRDGSAIVIDGQVRQGSNVRKRGEDVLPGDPLFPAGARIGPRHVAVLASQGYDRVAVVRRPTVTVISTGRELRDPAEALAAGQVFDANRPMLVALARRAGALVVDGGRVDDDPVAVAGAVTRAAASSDLVVTTGGVSVGEEDHSATALTIAGARFEVLRIAMKPGKPAIVGGLGDAAVLCLPGNPGAALVAWMTLGAAMLAAMSPGGSPSTPKLRLPLLNRHRRSPGRREFVPATLVDNGGRIGLSIVGRAGSGRLTPLLTADGFAEIAAGFDDALPGDEVVFHAFRELRDG